MGSDVPDRGSSDAPTVFAGGAAANAPTISAKGSAEPVATTWQLGSGQARYRTVATLGEGGMGRVVLAMDGILGRCVARKVATDPRHDTWLLSEAQINAQLEHPSIVPVHDVETDSSGRPSYLMRVVQGRTLRDILSLRARTGTPPLVELLGVLRQVCLAVDYAHEQGVVHRDLKPSNVIVGDFGEVYVLDWGVACITADAKVRVATALPAEGRVVGSLGYMAPEQARGDRADARADVFALGVILHEVLSGAMPFVEDTLEDVRRRGAAKQSVPPPPNAAPLPDPFRDLVRDCLRTDPARRPGSARVIVEAINAHLDQERQQQERERDADELVTCAEEHWTSFENLSAKAGTARADAERRFALLEPWSPIEDKRVLWRQQDEARQLEASAAETMARAETEYAAALNRASDNAGARRGLARLHYRHFCDAERAAEPARMASALELARAFDAGELSLELACESEISVEVSHPDAEIVLSRYERAGPLLVASSPQALGRGRSEMQRVAAGSYRVSVRLGEEEVHFPIDLARGRRFQLKARLRAPGEVPAGMVLIPGGPFLATLGTSRLNPATLPDFAVGRFPCTLGEYTCFLDALSNEEREARLPRVADGSAPLVIRRPDGWALAPYATEGAPIPPGRELDLPAHGLSWSSASAYARWLARESGRPYRLPTAAEWEKAMRGADGRPCPMGVELDYAFAKLRHSRPGISQLEPVGAFPLDESPYGVRDLAGGVADWTQSFADGAPPPQADGGKVRAVFRMGCHWGSTRELSPAGYLTNSDVGCVHAIGFRLALSLAGPGSELESEPMR